MAAGNFVFSACHFQKKGLAACLLATKRCSPAIIVDGCRLKIKERIMVFWLEKLRDVLLLLCTDKSTGQGGRL